MHDASSDARQDQKCIVSRWSIKPLYGLLSDFVPICGYHRLIYLLITTMINLGAWIALYFVPMEYNYLLFFCVLAAFSLAFNDVLSKIQRLAIPYFRQRARARAMAKKMATMIILSPLLFTRRQH